MVRRPAAYPCGPSPGKRAHGRGKTKSGPSPIRKPGADRKNSYFLLVSLKEEAKSESPTFRTTFSPLEAAMRFCSSSQYSS